MKMPSSLLPALLVPLLVAGCATESQPTHGLDKLISGMEKADAAHTQKEKDDLSARRKAYEGLLKFIAPGMTRRQLYALLPPRRTPQVEPSRMGMIGGIPFYFFHTENHPLDEVFSLRVEYRRVEVRKYLDRLDASEKKAKSLDAMVLSRRQAPPPVFTTALNQDDQIASRPVLLQKGQEPPLMIINQGMIGDLATAPAPQPPATHL